MQLKAIVKNMAIKKNISAQIVMQNYLMERLLERISLSNYRDNFILKGGFLIAAIVGLDIRATMDLDTTIKGFDLTHEEITRIFNELCAIETDDNITFELMKLTDIREKDDYPGIRVFLTVHYGQLAVSLTVDITTGDKITPREIEYSLKLLFDDREISVLAYNLETILAEKLETIISRGEANSRPRDFYDIYILYKLRRSDCDISLLKKALTETAKKRNSLANMADYNRVLAGIAANQEMNLLWNKYRKDFNYAKGITFEMVCEVVVSLLTEINP
jgi:predicted nucleotidyltransferase component of viral defense system